MEAMRKNHAEPKRYNGLVETVLDGQDNTLIED